MDRRATTEFLSELLLKTRLRKRSVYFAREVTLDYGTTKPRRVDFLQFEPPRVVSAGDIENGIFIAYEIKSCIEDVFSGHGLNLIGEKNYLVMTMQTYKDFLPRRTSGEFCKHLSNINPGLPQYYGVMVAIPEGRDPCDEFESPTPLETPNISWTLYIALPCRNGIRTKSIIELLFCMVRSGTHEGTAAETQEET